MSDQHDIVQLLALDEVDDVCLERIQRDIPRQQVLALAKPGLRRGEDDMALGAQPIRNPAPAPAAVSGAVHQHECLNRPLCRRYFVRCIRCRPCHCLVHVRRSPIAAHAVLDLVRKSGC
jgi:hypothetical protein